MASKPNTQHVGTPIVLIVGTVNAARLIRQRPELFADVTTGERFTVVKSLPTAYVGRRADFDGTDEDWRAHCRALFAERSDAAAAQCDTVAFKSAGSILNVIYASDAFESDPANGIYSPIPNPGAYRAMVECADNAVSVPSARA